MLSPDGARAHRLPRVRPRPAGHAEPGADPVRKISIMPRGRALGVTFQSPDADRYGYTDEYLRGRMAGMLGGRAAEEVVYGDSPPAPRPTSSRRPASPARWSAAGACPSRSAW